MWRNMKYYIGDLFSYLQKANEGRPPKVSF